MTCARYREAASARLDGEPIGLPACELSHHLAECVPCATWLEHATAAGRSLRVTAIVAPDLSGQILAAAVLPAARVARAARWLRVGLALLALVQLALAVPALFGDDVSMQMSLHASHESAAWNLAVGVAFLSVALRPSRAAGVVPLLASFVGVLTVLSLPDLADGSVAAGRLASHLGVVIGLALVLMVQRSHRLLPVLGAAKVVPQILEQPSEDRPRRWGAA